MTDEQRKLCALLRTTGLVVCDRAATEIERLAEDKKQALNVCQRLLAREAARAQSDAEPVAADYIPIGGAGNGA